MTILGLEILLHYASRANDFRYGELSAPAVLDATHKLAEEGLLINRTGEPHLSEYAITDKGKVFVTHLQSTPLPVAEWKIPGQDKSCACDTQKMELRQRNLETARRAEARAYGIPNYAPCCNYPISTEPHRQTPQGM